MKCYDLNGRQTWLINFKNLRGIQSGGKITADLRSQEKPEEVMGKCKLSYDYSQVEAVYEFSAKRHFLKIGLAEMEQVTNRGSCVLRKGPGIDIILEEDLESFP